MDRIVAIEAICSIFDLKPCILGIQKFLSQIMSLGLGNGHRVSFALSNEIAPHHRTSHAAIFLVPHHVWTRFRRNCTGILVQKQLEGLVFAFFFRDFNIEMIRKFHYFGNCEIVIAP